MSVDQGTGAGHGAGATPRVELLHDLDRETGRVLLVDGVEQSYVDVADPTHLEFEYMQHVAVVVDTVLPRPLPIAAVHLGGGALTMPRWVASTRPHSRQLVVESSPEVLAATASLAPVPLCEVVPAPVEQVWPRLPQRWADLVVWDLYDGPRAVTAALTSESVEQMRRLLRAPDGVVVLNVSDAAPFDVVRPVLAALAAHFASAVLLAEPATLRGRRSGNCVLAASVQTPFPLPLLLRAAAGAPTRARVVAGDALGTFVGGARPGTARDPLPLPDEALGRGFL